MFERLKKETKRDLDLNPNEDINKVIYGNESIYGLLRRYQKQSKEKQIRYKIIGIKRRLNDVNLLRNEILDLLVN